MRKTTKSGKNARTTAPTKAKADLMLDARNAADEYAQIRVEFTASNEGYRSRVYKFAANCYSIGLGFMENQAAYKRFMADPFWKTVRQVPKDGDIMKAVLTFAMKPKSTTLRNRVLKTATVLSRLAKEKVVASAVVDRFKTGGGIEKMYSRIYPNSTFPTLVADVLGLLSETPSEDVADLQPAPKEDTDE